MFNSGLILVKTAEVEKYIFMCVTCTDRNRIIQGKVMYAVCAEALSSGMGYVC